ncbi:unnamed protein product [marine sediment metagenome]|uniref:Uncharacterized protein n=1 Tax=marine sediment metagenome TaxID=412755 RepID=X1D6Y5_9ZZZZ
MKMPKEKIEKLNPMSEGQQPWRMKEKINETIGYINTISKDTSRIFRKKRKLMKHQKARRAR